MHRRSLLTSISSSLPQAVIVWTMISVSDSHSGHGWSGSRLGYVFIAMPTMLPAIPGTDAVCAWRVAADGSERMYR
jgi:hypothetical protein